ncbi:hypothetical protein H6770_02800 [Candidatus Peribacteria bacterium]|nr:hypothetical protein [Candidatus Peribacteria bacterium]
MLAVSDARRLLGDDGKYLTDEQVETLVQQLTVIADMTLDIVIQDLVS